MTSIKLYSKQNCTQCEQAKILLKMKGVDVDILMLDVDYTLEDVKAVAPNQRTFPVIVGSDNTLIGGLSELKEYLKNV